MTNAHEYHRTFNILRLSGRLPNSADLARNMDLELKEARAKYRGFPDRQAIDLLRADKLRNQKPVKVHDAVEDTGTEYRTARIEEKGDQNFEKFATPWELIWSRLVMYWESRLTPVVDSSGLVIFYTGNIEPKYFLIDYAGGSASTPLTAETGMKNVEVLQQYRLYVGTKEFFGRPDLGIFGSNNITRHTVVTDIYGEVMSYEIGSRRDDSISGVSLLDISGALGLVRTAFRVGLGLVISLGKTGLRTLTRRPPIPPRGDPAWWQKKFDDLAKLNKGQRRITVGNVNPRVQGRPEANITVVADKEREIHAANRFANRSDMEHIHLGDDARRAYNAPTGKFPDVVAKKRGSLEFALSEGKGTDMAKVIEQFKAATPKIKAAETARAGGKGVNIKITEQEVVVERLVPMPVQGGTLMSPGAGFGVDKEGFLLDARGFVDLKAGMPTRIMEANGIPIRVITMEYVGGPIQHTK